MFKAEVKGGLVTKLATSGDLTTLQSDITVVIAQCYASLKGQNEKAAKQFLKGLRIFFSSDECNSIMDDYASTERLGNGISICEVKEVEEPEKPKLSREELERLEKTLEELAKKLGADVEDED